ncbi:MAG: hypothetical protein RR063_05730, partial [Anaerovoracaceae bacterium]
NGISLAISGFGARLLPAFANTTSWHSFCAVAPPTASLVTVLAQLLRQKTQSSQIAAPLWHGFCAQKPTESFVLAQLLPPKAQNRAMREAATFLYIFIQS